MNPFSWCHFLLYILGCCNCSMVEIVSIVDQSSLFPCMVKMHSIIQSSRQASMLRFHFLALDNSTVSDLESSLSCFRGIKYVVKLWKRSPTFPKISSRGFDSEVIYSRIYLPYIFNVDKYIYIDNDVVVNADLRILFQLPLIALAKSPYTPRRRNQTPGGSTHTIPMPVSRHPSQKAVMGFVYDLNSVHRHYINSHFNRSHTFVKSILSRNDPDLFFNGGVALVDAKLWRAQDLTRKAEDMIAQNGRDTLYSSTSVGDQGLFHLLLAGQLAALPAEFNMRRLPNKTVRLLEKNVLGIVHFAGSTRGNASILCDEPTQYPYFTAGAMPLYLSVVHSLHMKCPDVIHIPATCFSAVTAIRQEERSGVVRVMYNPGYGSFNWPPSMGLQPGNRSALMM